ncbi:MAG: NAD-dependent epimerase/dehydratase family protein [Synechococcales cyanobacterium CRU_2_2]|nr:NAD-dependent epimerase/dehydratase family protein [Synechococcales cyanobacterium CRU_2_2]
MTTELTAKLKAHKPTVIALFQGQLQEQASEQNTQAQIQESRNQHSERLQAPPEERLLLKQEQYRADLKLAESIRPVCAWAYIDTIQPPQHILLTGATGFLGVFLLRELLQQTRAKIHCLVRADSVAKGHHKILDSLHRYQLCDRALSSEAQTRIVPVVGDLARPNLGLPPEAFAALSQTIDVIYHNAAWVHHASPYSRLRDTNVCGTQTLLQLACQAHPKPFHYSSTLSVLPAQLPEGKTRMYEQDPLSQYPVPKGGYTQSKWVAEQLVTQAGDRGLPITLYRPGPISGHSQTGVFNRDDFLYRLMQGYIQLGSAPVGEMPLDLLPVDYVSWAMVYLSRQPRSLGKTFHLIHPHPVSSELLFAPLAEAGYSIQRVSYQAWYRQLMAIAHQDPSHALYPLVSLFSSRRQTAAQPESTAQAAPSEVPFDCKNTRTALDAAPKPCPALSPGLFKTYISAMQQADALPPARAFSSA